VALTDQMIRASRLDIALYEEVEADTTQTTNALTIVVISALCSGIGAAISASMTSGANAPSPILALLGTVVAAVVGWAIGSGCIYWVGTRFFGGTATWGEVMRTLGYASSPGILRIFTFIPVLGSLIGLVVGIWTIVTNVVAIRQALDVSTGKAIVAGIIGGLLALIPVVIISELVLAPAAMVTR
jgi:hypothetical protein